MACPLTGSTGATFVRADLLAESGHIEFSLFGRNEPALHHYHSTYRSLLGLEPLPLLTEAEV